MSDATLNEALKYAQLNLHVIPIIPGQKYPPMPEWQKAATADKETIQHWWNQQYTNHGIGIAPRQLADGRWLFILDIDEKPEASGSETLRELTDAYGPLPDTPTVHSGSGKGIHYYFTAPFEIRNDQSAKIGPGIDVRGHGGQVCAPPTIHQTGNQYTWDLEYNLETTAIAEAPGWLLAMLTPTEAPKAAREQNNGIWDELDDSPAGIYNRTKTWEEILFDDGWKLDRTDRTGEKHWIRPGKNDGTSATTGYKQLDILKVFTTSLNWLPEGTYSKFKYYAHSKHSGNMSEAAKAILRDQSISTTPMVAAEPTDPWPDPIQLTVTTQTPQFPVHTLPDWITNQTQQIARNIQVAHDLPASLALGALSTITLGNTKIRYQRNNWNQPLNLYIAITLPPSAGKTPAKNAIFWPLEQIELERIAEAKENKDLADSDKRMLEKELRRLEENVTKNPDNIGNDKDHRHHIIQKLNQLPKHSTGRLLVDDTTTEALGVTLSENGGHIALISAEGGLFDRIAGMYNDGTANLDLFLEAWSGGRYIVDRIKRDSIQIPSANLTIVTTIQPQTLTEIGARKQFAGRGLTARFLITKPTTNVGTRDRLKTTHIDNDIETIYNNKIIDLARKYHGTTTELIINQQASDRYANWDQNLENQLGEGQPLDHLAEWIGKLRANTLRIAGLLHIAHNQPGTEVTLDIMEKAIEIANYYLDHMLAISDEWGTDEITAKALKIIKWIKRTKPDTITIRELMRHNRRTINTADETIPILQLLTDKAYIRPLFDGSIMTGQRGKASQEFGVNPKIYVESETSQLSYNAEPIDKVVTHVAHNSPLTAQTYTNNTVCDVKLSRMSRMSPKGGFELTSSSEKNIVTPPTPGDMDDMDDNFIHSLKNLI